MRYQGRLVEWNDDKGFGFIQPLQDLAGDKKIFLHIKSFAQRGPRPIEGCLLEYGISVDGQGRPNASQVKYIKKNQQKAAVKNTNLKNAQKVQAKPWRIWLVVAYMVFLLALVMTQQLPPLILFWPLAMGVVTYIFYSIDKTAAQKGERRIPESTLHIFAVLGGWCGALFAQQKLRHKTIKVEFQRLFWISVILNWLVMAGLTLLNLQQWI